jgi:hypothetical protein
LQGLSVHSRTLFLGLGLAGALTGCAGMAADPSASAPVVNGSHPAASAPAPEASAVMQQQLATEPASAPVANPSVPVVPPVVTPAKPATPPVASYTNEREGRLLLDRLLPQGIPDRKGWSNDVFNAFTALKIPYTPQYFCGVLAVAEQESDYQSDPVTPNLSKIVWDELEQRSKKYFVPKLVMQAALLKTSPDGRSYKERIDTLRTKRQLNALYEDMVRELPFGQTVFEKKNPIRDGGPMQVSVAFAESHVKVWPYPYSYRNLRDEVFSRRGSVYFGTAILLQYPVQYSDMVYYFADYNAGRYSSRNAAFQAALARLAKRKLALDGDLLQYDNQAAWKPATTGNNTLKAAVAIASRLHMSQDEIVRDLKLEKQSNFSQSPLYQRVFAQADQLAGKRLPREIIPQIVLVSPKISHHLTTEWFARKVDGRYRACLARGGL